MALTIFEKAFAACLVPEDAATVMQFAQLLLIGGEISHNDLEVVADKYRAWLRHHPR